MATQGFFGARGAGAALVCAVLLGGFALLHAPRRDPPGRADLRSPARVTDPATLRAAADAGDDAALAVLIERLDEIASIAAQGETVVDLLRSARPEVRAAACAWIGRRERRDLAPLLFPRMNDADWRVRAAAFDAMGGAASHIANAPASAAAPLRDTPVEAREDVLFTWLRAWQAGGRDARPALPPLPEPCELYAPSGGHWLTGAKLARSCLACHAPSDRYAEADFAGCADCHRTAHDEFFRSAHARSTTHINLSRVNERTKLVERYDPGPREGLVCTSCHVPAPVAATAPAAGATKPLPPGTEALAVPHRFAAVVACATCHAETQAEWETWRATPRPVPSRWLPGEFTWDGSPDARTCVSCHMGSRSAADGLGHAFASRRDAVLMRGGMSAHVEPATPGRAAQLVLTNLAGHRYPSGTIRRALRVELRYDTDTDDSPPRLLGRLTDSPLPTTAPTQPALAPGEQRRIDLPAHPGSSRATCWITFERNQYQPGSYELLLHRLTERVTPPIPTPTPER